MRSPLLRLALVGTVALLTASACVPPEDAPRPAPGSTSSATLTPATNIDRTGATDVTAKLQAFLNGVPHHARVVFPRGARYRIEGTLTVRNRNDLVLDGNGATFFATQPTTVRHRSQWHLENLSNAVIQNMTIRGAHPNGGADGDFVVALEAQHGINVVGGERIVVRNNTITDVYGDFVYVGRSERPTFGVPTDVHIHHNTMRRNGRQGVSVTHGTRVVIEHNDLAETRRASFDLEPNTDTAWVRDVTIRNNRVGPGRLNFVAGHGSGIVSDLRVERNTLHGRTMSVDLKAPAGLRRANVLIAGNTTDTSGATSHGSMMRITRYDHVVVRDNVQPTNVNREMRMVGFNDSCDVSATGNDLGPHGDGQLLHFSQTYDCSQVGAPASPSTPALFSGSRLELDVGGAGVPDEGVFACRSQSNCSGFIVGGTTSQVTSSKLLTSVQNPGRYRSMLQGNPRFSIPIRSGTYDVRLSFVEPTAEPRDRRFHLDIERVRKLSSFDVHVAANGKHRLVHRTFRVTVGDGALDVVLDAGTGPAILSYLSVTRL